MKMILMLTALLMGSISMAETIRAKPLRMIQDDEGQKIIVELQGAPQVIYLKKMTPNYDLLVDLFQVSAEAKKDLTITLDEDYTRSVLSAKRQ